MQIDATEIIGGLATILLTVIWWEIRRMVHRLDGVEERQESNTGRLIRIETRLGIVNNGDHLV